MHVEPALVRHHDVHQDHVGLQRPRLEDRLAGVARLADRLDVVLRGEQEPQPAADDGVVVDDQDADAHASGTSATIVVPAPGRDSISSRPSTSASRSRMPEEPEAAPRARAPRVEAALPSSSITARDGARAAREDDADVVARRRA